MFRPWIHELVMRIRNSGPGHRYKNYCKPVLELLENRLAPSVSWINPDGGDWDTPGNWSTAIVPGAADDVTISGLLTGSVITHSQGDSDAINSLTSDGPVSISNGTLSVASNSTISSDLTLSGGTLAGAGTLTVSGSLSWTGGTMAGSGRTVVAAGGTLFVSSAASRNMTLARTLENDGAGTWVGPDDFTNADFYVVFFGGTLVNAGTLTFLSASTGAASYPFLYDAGGANRFSNVGTVVQQGDGTTHVGVPLDNGGTVQVQGGTLSLSGGGTNAGLFAISSGTTLAFDGGTHALSSGASVAGPGAVQFHGGTATFASGSAYNVTAGTAVAGGTATFSPGSTVTAIGPLTLSGGGITFSAGAPVTTTTLSQSGGTLDGSDDVTVSGSVSWTGGTMAGSGRTVVAGGGTLSVSSAASRNMTLSRTLENDGAGTWAGPDDFNIDFYVEFFGGTLLNAGTLTFLSASTGAASYPYLYDAGGANRFTNTGTVVQQGDGTTHVGVPFTSTGNMVIDSGTLALTNSSFIFGGYTRLASQPAATLNIPGDLLGSTKQADLFSPEGTLLLNGSGNADAPQLLEAMSQDFGNASAGYTHNFAYGSLALANNTYVRLVDNAHNSTGAGPEALYVSGLTVPSGATLDLDGLHVYARGAQILGHVVNGSVQFVPDGGALILNTPSDGAINVAGQTDDWTFFGRAGQTVTVVAGTGRSSNPVPPSPAVGYVQVTVLDASGNVLGVSSNSQSETNASIVGVTLPVDGTYHVRVQVPANHASSTGFYSLIVADATVHTAPLTVNGLVTGQLASTYSADRWTFSATAGQQVQFKLRAAARADIQFDLTGPNGYTAFSGATASSGLIDLPSSGAYTITVHTVNVPGAYAFQILQTSVRPLILGTPDYETLAASGQAQLFTFTASGSNSTLVNLTDGNSQDHNEVYVKYGGAPTRDSCDYRFTSAAAANQDIVFTSRPGTYYVLVYNDVVSAPGVFALTVQSEPFIVTSSSPGRIGDAHDGTLLIQGVFPVRLSEALVSSDGFELAVPFLSSKPTVQFVTADGTAYPDVPLPLTLISDPTYLTNEDTSGVGNLNGTVTTSVTIPANTLTAGAYSLRITDDTGYSQTLPNALTVVHGGIGVLKTNVIIPNPIGNSTASTIYVQYSNVGDAPLSAPLLVLSASRPTGNGAFMTLDPSLRTSGFWTSATPDGYSSTVQFLASGSVPGTLLPGESVTVPVYYAGWAQSQWFLPGTHDLANPITFNLGALTDDNRQTIDWTLLKSTLKPATLGQDAWDALYPNLAAQLGSTWGDYVKKLDADIQYLHGIGETVTDISQLFGFEVQLAAGFSPLSNLAVAADAQVAAPGLDLSLGRSYGPSLVSRNDFGRYGWGWSDSWQTSITVDADGSVNVHGQAGSLRRFQPDRRGGYFAQPGDHGVLAAIPGDGYTLTELDGQVTAYYADGSLNYVQDTNGNRITAGYTGGLLTSLTHSSGQFLHLAYNAAGLVSGITDSAGRTTTYSYDPTSQYLASVTTFDGQTTTYTYDTGNDPMTAHALLSVSHSDGTHDFFTYNPQGRLADAHRDGGAHDTTFAYVEGQVIVADALDDQTVYFFDDRGLLVAVQNPLGHGVQFAYDQNLNLVQMIDAGGQVYKNTYDTQGNLLSSTDPLGHTVNYTYAATDDRLASVTDARGNAMQYGYDGQGNLTSTTYADGTVESVAHDPVGNVLSVTNRRGQAIHYTYDAAGNVLTKTFPDGSQVVFTYDAHENLTSATDASGTTTLAYDTNDRLTQITYPSGRFLHYTYDAAGRRTQMVDQDGFTVNYGYDTLGRLATLADGSNNPIVRYTYDSIGRLSREDKGNGTYTTYDYDAASELLHLVNFAPNGTVNSRFDYTYDVFGHRITEATVDGAWTYSYDAIGQLTHAVFASTNPAITNQDLAYAYDAAGNRTQTIISGVTTAYTTNGLNEYTQVGSMSYGYDADGNLTSQTDGSATTSFAYNAQDQLVGMSGPSGSWTYQYDAFGNRMATTANGETTQYLIDPTGLGNIVGEFGASGSRTASYAYGLGLAATAGTGSFRYYDFDTLGSTAGVSGTSGGYVNRYAYDPFGGSVLNIESFANPFQFVGGLGVMSAGGGLVSCEPGSTQRVKEGS